VPYSADFPPPIEDYALIGDCATAALVSKSGSIDWLCWPRFDGSACFAALLGQPEHGRWQIAPADPAARVRRAYRDCTMILETVFETAEGCVALIDFMPPFASNSSIVRIVEGRRGRVKMCMHMALRFDYGVSVPWVTQLEDGRGLRAIAGPDMVVLRTDVELRGEDLITVAEFTVGEGEQVPFVMTQGPSHMAIPPAVDAGAALRGAEAFWSGWVGRGGYKGDYLEPVRRSLLTLKALTFVPTGGIVAAPTTSLPEQLGGTRNWDYRFCWLRDATFTLLALLHAGYADEARLWREWLHRAIAGTAEQVQIMYGLAGERRVSEWEVDWLPGYQGAAPVRIGNAAAGQLQIDVYGEVMDALYQSHKGGLAVPEGGWDLQANLIEHLETIWQQPDEGIWEVRGGRRCFTFSKVMAWVALDRAVRTMEEWKCPGPLDRWRALRAEMHREICSRGFSTAKNSFVQSYGSESLDASLLLAPLVGFLPIDDPRVRGTIAAIERELIQDGLVMRYRTQEGADGLPPGEGVFLACSFWLADNMVLQRRYGEARTLFERLLDLRNDVGLLSEEYDPRARRLVGNFPQAFSHIGVIGTALNLANYGPAHSRSADGK
jgi:GH15 family glucan-1,4-alpha-glucosidase